MHGFPILFLYGPTSTGKDQLINSILSLFGEPHSAINIQANISTPKGQIREFAQFTNMICHLSEYKSGDKKINGMLKGLWDRNGYKRGTIDSYVSNEDIPVLSSTILTGNEFPNDEAVITRVLWEEMTKSEFSSKEKDEYNQLKEMVKKGMSHFMQTLIKFRPLFKEKAKTMIRKVEYELNSDSKHKDVKARIKENLAIVGSVYQILKDEPEINFPFNWKNIYEHFNRSISWQMRKIDSTNLLTMWWNCFLYAVREKTDPIQYGREFRLEGNQLLLRFSLSFSKVAKSWWALRKEIIPNVSILSEALKKSAPFIEKKNKDWKLKSSAWVFELKKVNIYEDLVDAINWQEQDQKTTEPVPMSIKNKENNSLSDLDQIPF